MLPKHAFLNFVQTKSSSIALLSIHKETIDSEALEELTEFFDQNLKRNKQKVEEWIIKVDEAHEIVKEVDKIMEELDKADDESDDEPIAEAIARRTKQVSTYKVIDDENTKFDSDDENVTKLCRRLRHVYAVMKEQREEIKMLKGLLKK